MKTRRSPHRGVLALAVGALLFSSISVSAQPLRPIEPLPPEAFSRVEPTRTPYPTSAPADIVPTPEPSPSGPPASPRTRERAPLRLIPGPPPAIQTLPKAVVDPPVRSSTSSRSLSGVASWYCGHGSRCTRGHPGGLYAAIRRDLLYLRGKQVTVISGSRRVVVTIIDCNCGRGANLIDLYADAFDNLAPLSRGRISVTVVLP